ncbi:MAG TPA: lipoate--protein ligase [Gemmatimonadaceae bacterium]|nr:lipoate--protein ligase [Gemmatimonadaceae bacterium]
MEYIWNGGITDARLNLALEEYALRHFRGEEGEEGYLLFYVNDPAIIVGRNQNTVEEIDAGVVAERGIQVVRRMSGGGAVYHDRGNLNFSFITPYAPERFNRYDLVTRPVVEVLRDLGVPAELSGRNDIVVDGRKISGNAQFAAEGRMFSHGTLLFDSKLDDVARALRPKPGKVESKGAKSVRSRVANIREFLAEPMPLDELRLRILARMFGDDVAASTRVLTPEEWRGVRELAARKYGAWEWNYGESPAFTLRRAHRYATGEVDVRLEVERGRIGSVQIRGDFLGREPVSELERRLVGVAHAPEALRETLSAARLEEYISGVSADELVDLIAG